MDFVRPHSAPALLRALRSAACYAELALVSSSWGPYSIEHKVYDRKPNYSGPKKARGTFYSQRNGTVLPPRCVNDVEKKFPRSRIRWWSEHPIAQILCDASLEQDGVLKALGTCPAGDERRLMWDEEFVGMLSGERFRVEKRDCSDTIAALVGIGSVESLLVLIGRMRLAQLRGGDTSLDMAYERAIWETLPTCIARSPHLYFGHEALLAALEGFLSWSPFSDSRFLTSVTDKSVEKLRQSYIARLSEEVLRQKLTLPPEEHMLIRKRIVDEIVEGRTKQ